MKLEERTRRAYTFDDYLLEPQHSHVLPSEVDVRTKFTRNISLGVPILSAAMDKVTESGLSIALAQQGGCGVLHRKLSIKAQSAEVDRVKRSQSGMIVDPVTLAPHHVIAHAIELMDRHHISGVPITEDGSKEGRLVGILTNRDLRFEVNHSRPISERMTKGRLYTVPVHTTMEEAAKKFDEFKVEKLPVVDDEGNLKGLITLKDLQKNRNFPNAAKDELGRLIVAAAIGVDKNTLARAAALVEKNVDVLVIDTAHAHHQRVLDVVKQVREQFASVDLVAGNIATGDAARALVDLGVDAVKVGIGAGSICTTRVVAGIGVPMMTAINDCAEAVRGQVPVIADGGLRLSGDITKALAAGASCVMLGMLLAGTDEAPGEIILLQGRSFKEYRGMGSLGAMNERYGSRDRYFQDREENATEEDEFDLESRKSEKLVPEGIEGRVAHKGPVADQIHQLVGGLQAGMGYAGARTIQDLWGAPLILTSPAGQREGHVHDVIITKEAPNYRVQQ